MRFSQLSRSLKAFLSGHAEAPLRTRPRRKRARLSLETLETRWLLSTVPNDPLFDRMYGLEITHTQEAWDLTTGSTQVTVAVIDTGVDYTHPDLYKNIWLNQAEIPSAIRAGLQDVDVDGAITFWDLNELVNQGPGKITDLNGTGFIDGGDVLQPAAAGGWADGIDSGSNGFVDDLIGWDFGHNDNDPRDFKGHGTHVAGTIGAIGDNGIGVAGMNWNVQLMPVKRVTDVDTGTVQNTTDAIYYAVDNGARVSNNSYGRAAANMSAAEVAAAHAAIQYAADRGHLFVACAHNQGNDNDVVPLLPASYDLNNIISVASTDKREQLAHTSNYGDVSVDLAAPGVGIYSTVPDGRYAKLSGTSMATPHVTGAAALIWAREPNLTYAEVKNRILSSVDSLADLQGKTLTGGRLNVFAALNAANVSELSPHAATNSATFSIPTATSATGDGAMTSASVPEISVSDFKGKEGNKGISLFVFTVTVSNTSALPVTVNFATAPGTAIPGSLCNDDVSTAGTLTFAPGETIKTITVQINGDREKESDETFSAILSDPLNSVLADGLGLATIRHDGDNQLFGNPAG